MRRLFQLICASMGLLLIMTTLILQSHRDGEGVPSLIAMQGQDSRRLVRLLPLARQATPLTPSLIGLELVAWTPDGLLYTATSGQGDITLYRLPHIGATPQILAEQLQPNVVMSENGAWVVVADSGGLGGNYGLRAIRTDGSENHPLTLDLQEDLEINQGTLPVISPDGTWIAFSVYEPTGDLDVYRVRNDGTGLENLTDDLQGVAQPVAWSSVAQGFVVSFNNSELWQMNDTLGQLEPLLPTLTGVKVWITDVDAAGLELVYVDSAPLMVYAIRPDGRIVWQVADEGLYSFAKNGAWGIGIQGNQWIRIRGEDGASFPFTLLSGPKISYSQWSSPDGRHALLEGFDLNGAEELWRFDAETGKFFLLWMPSGLVHDVRWLSDGIHTVVTIATLDKSFFVWMDTRTGELIWQWDTSYFVGWGPPYQKDWSAGWSLIIGLALTSGIIWPRIFHYFLTQLT